MATLPVHTAQTHWGRFVAAATLVALLVLVVLAARMWGARLTALLVPPDDSVPLSEHWVSANLPVDARLVADSAVMADLAKAGIPGWDLVDYRALDAQPATDAAAGWRVYDYIVSTPALRTGLSASGQVRTALASSTVVASYGAGPGRVEVREIDAQGLPAAADRVSKAEAASAAAGRQMLSSERVKLSPVAAQQVVTGMVDGRVLSVLVGLGSQFSLTVAGFSDPDPGGMFENRLRQVAVLVVDGTLVADRSQQVAAVTDWLAAQQGAFRPSAVAVHGNQLLIRFRLLGAQEIGAL